MHRIGQFPVCGSPARRFGADSLAGRFEYPLQDTLGRISSLRCGLDSELVQLYAANRPDTSATEVFNAIVTDGDHDATSAPTTAAHTVAREYHPSRLTLDRGRILRRPGSNAISVAAQWLSRTPDRSRIVRQRGEGPSSVAGIAAGGL